MNTDDRALADRLRKVASSLTNAFRHAPDSPNVTTILSAADRLEAFHAKPVVGERWTDDEWQRLLRIVHAAITENAPGGLTPGRIDVLADSVMHALDDDQAAALQSPPPVVSTPGVNCPSCGHRLPVDYSGPCVACDAPDVPDLNAPPVVSGGASDGEIYSRASFGSEEERQEFIARILPVVEEGRRDV